MDLTTEMLARYVGGQIEVKNDLEVYLYRGEIESIEVQEDGHGGKLAIRLVWQAKAEGYPLPERWVSHPDLDYEASLAIYWSKDIGSDRIMLVSPVTGEQAVLYPNGGSTLDRAKVEGLQAA